MKTSIGVTLLTGVGALALASIANAQAPQTTAAATAAPAELQEVTVTGSRVITNGNDSPTPVTVISAQELQATQSSTITQGLMNLPAFAGSSGPTITGAATPGPNPAQIAAVSLDGLGPTRTLVLWDGHRVPPTQQNGNVDANTIPQMLLQRVDVVTGGASAVYGSDAIGGVVNYITDKNFNGIKADLQGGIAQREFDDTHKLDIAAGMRLFGGRGHIEGSAEWLYDEGVLNRNSIYGNNTWTIFGNGSAADPYFLANHGVNTVATFGGKITGPTAKNPLLNYTFNANGVATPFVLGTTPGPVAGTTNEVGGDGVYFQGTTLAPRVSQEQVYGRFDFDVSDNVHYYLSAAGTVDGEESYTTDTNIMNVNIGVNNAFLPAAYQQQLAAAGLSTFAYSYVFGPNQSVVSSQGADYYTRSLYLNTGLNGKLGKYNWDISYSRVNLSAESHNFEVYNNGRLFAALDAVNVTAANVGTSGLAIGSIACNVTLLNPGLYPGCVPINLFGPTATSQAAANYIREVQEFRTHLPSDDVSASISGAPFNDWAGPVKVAASGEYRSLGMDVDVSQPTVNLAPQDCTGLRFNNCVTPTATNPGTPQANQASAPRPLVNQSIYEGALEADAPLLKNLPLAQAVDLDLAYRYAKYTTSGNPNILAPNYDSYFSADTWKLGLDWHFNDMVKLRATRSRDFRAPNLNDLYSPQSITFGGGSVDTWTNSGLTPTGANPELLTQGNANLQPEVAYTTTAGLVLEPFQNFSVAIDYFKVNIANYIASIAGSSNATQASCYASGGSSNYCSLIVRPQGNCYSSASCSKVASVNAVTEYITEEINIANFQTQGVDLEANYAARPFGHALALRYLLAYQPHLLLVEPGVLSQDTAGQDSADAPQIRMTAMAHYNATDNLSFDWQTRWRSHLHYTTLATQFANPNTGVPSVTFSDLTVSYLVAHPFGEQSSLQVFLNIQDVFNQIAPVIGGGSFPTPQGFAPGDWPFGRYFTAGVHFKM